MGNRKKRTRQCGSDSSGATDANVTFLIDGDRSNLNTTMSDMNVQRILDKIVESKIETVNELTSQFSKSEHDLRDELEKVNGSLTQLQIENTRLRKTVEKYREEQVNLQSEIDSLKGIVKAQDLRMHDLEQYGRRNNIKIYGLAEGSKSETAVETGVVVRKFCRERLGVTVAETDIDIAHRLGARQRDRHRSIIVKFVRREVKQEVVRQRRKLKQSGIVVTDDLTPRHQQLLRNMKEVVGRDNCWSAEGSVFVKLGGQVKKVNIHSTQQEIRDQMERGERSSGSSGGASGGTSGGLSDSQSGGTTSGMSVGQSGALSGGQLGGQSGGPSGGMARGVSSPNLDLAAPLHHSSQQGPGSMTMASTPYTHFHSQPVRGFGRGRGRGSPANQGAATSPGDTPSRHPFPLDPHVHVAVNNTIEQFSPS
ncbi:hypothetical protein BaRGS_00010517 [Batillaria attramentaria]|uniref:Uncharacterized protein n=2 Tax=Batillaria attramentaria TaxID=370345 RepID=A0ABD0JJN1_9CAEN